MELAPGQPTDWRRYDDLALPGPLRGALEIFTAKGYHGGSVRDIARSANMTVPGLYYHFPSKQAMLVALLDTCVGEILVRARAAEAQAAPDPYHRFVNVVESIVLSVVHRSSLAILDSELRYLDPDGRRHYAAMRKELETLLLGIVRAGAKDATFTVDRPVDTTRALLGMFQAIATWYVRGGALSPTQIARRYVAIAARTVGR